MQEQQVYDQEVAQVQAWFQSERFKHVKRPYTAKEGAQLPRLQETWTLMHCKY